MSRLQVGGLALCLKNGFVCTLVEHFGDGYNRMGEFFYDNWLVEYNELVPCDLTGDLSTRLYEESRNLMPLGDKQTQDEFKRDGDNTMKKSLMKLKLKFIKKNAPEDVTHWREDFKLVEFYRTDSFDESIESIIIKKPLWLILIEAVLYSRFTDYKNNPILTSIISACIGAGMVLILALIYGWAV